MAFDRSLLHKVKKEKELLRAENQRLLEQRTEEIHQTIPEIWNIDRKLRSTASAVVTAALARNEDPEDAIRRLKTENLALQQRRRDLLEQAGYPADYLTLPYACPLCKDTGYVEDKLCSCVKTRYSQYMAEALSQVLPLQEENFETFSLEYYSPVPDGRLPMSPRENMRHNLAFCKDYAVSFHPASKKLLLFGASGLGKTFLSSCIAKTVTERGYFVCYDTAINLLDNFERCKFRDGGKLVSAGIDRYFDCDLLIIDDLGTELTTSFTISVLYHLINSRILQKKPMILNTNLSPADLEKRYSPAIASRINGDFVLLRFFGDDIRLLKKNTK